MQARTVMLELLEEAGHVREIRVSRDATTLVGSWFGADLEIEIRHGKDDGADR